MAKPKYTLALLLARTETPMVQVPRFMGTLPNDHHAHHHKHGN